MPLRRHIVCFFVANGLVLAIPLAGHTFSEDSHGESTFSYVRCRLFRRHCWRRRCIRNLDLVQPLRGRSVSGHASVELTQSPDLQAGAFHRLPFYFQIPES
jgi:hypothetical protein